MLAADPAVLVKPKSAVPVRPLPVAVTVYEPALVFAVAVTDAKPSAFVCADAADKFALGSSLPGAVKFTVTPDTGFPSLSVTNAFNGSPNAVVTKVVCPEPLLIA